MAMNFWEAQQRARSKTTLYLSIFLILTFVVAIVGEFFLRSLGQENYDPPVPLFGCFFLIMTFLVAAYNYSMYQQYGGSYVAESVGARLANPKSSDFKEKQLLNIVEEMALATSLPVPPVYIIPSRSINAFAAGLTPDNAAIAITRGALELLNRDETQGVIAHEFGHIYNGDMCISMRLAAMVMGFFFVFYIGLRLLQFAPVKSRDNKNNTNPMMIAAVALLVAGAFTWLFGTILKASVSREREYLADACAVQFTRNPKGIANALKKIANEVTSDMPKNSNAFSHMYIEDHSAWSFIFATHPPIQKRIAAIESGEYQKEAGSVDI